MEVQVDYNISFAHRSLYYWAKNYADLTPTVCINLLDFEIFPELPGYHSCFHITEVDAPEFILSEHLQSFSAYSCRFPVYNHYNSGS